MTKTLDKTIGYLCILTASVCWGMLGVWSRHLTNAGLSAGTLASVRLFGAMLLLTLVFLIKDRSVFHVERQHLKYFPATGIGSVLLYTLCYLSCQKVCSLAIATMLSYTSPCFVMLVAALLWKEPVTRKKLLALVFTLLGCALACGVFAGNLTATPAGILIGVVGGFFYGMYSIFGRYPLAHYPPMTVTVWTFLFAGTVSLVLIKPAELALLLSSPRLLLLALGMAAVSTASPYLLYTCGLARVESSKAAILVSAELITATLAGALAFGEPIGAATVGGLACILAGICILR